jgi:hypothetical protein
VVVKNSAHTGLFFYLKCNLFCTVMLLFITTKSTNAQYYSFNNKYYDNALIVEIGGGLGAINCLTDLGGGKGYGRKFFKDINWKNTQSCANIYAGVFVNDVWGIRLEGTFGNVTAYDSILKKFKDIPTNSGRYYRNLNFRSRLSEIAIVAELHPLNLLDFFYEHPPVWSPYILAGVGRFSFDPEAYYQGKWIRLHPLKLEGQGFAEYRDRAVYRLNATTYPMGVGIRYEASQLVIARLEINHRFTSTDYLDDVSEGLYVDPALFAKYLNASDAALATQLYDRHYELNPNYKKDPGEIRGQKINKDAFFTFNLKVAITLGRQKK